MGPCMWPHRPTGNAAPGAMRVMFGGEWPFRPWWVRSREYPPASVRENDEKVTIEFEIPGVSTGDIDLTITGESLSLKVRRRPEGDLSRETYQVRERRSGDFERSVGLAGLLDTEKATASYRNGVLSVNIPKAKAAEPRKIEIAVK